MDAITADAVTFAERGDALLADSPLRAIRIEDPEQDDWEPEEVAARIAAGAWLAEVESIAIPLYSAFGEAAWLRTIVAAAPALRELRVPHPSSVEGLADLPLSALRALHVYCEGARTGDRALAAFAGRDRALDALQLVGCGITDATARAIAAAGWPLRYLAFGGTHYVEDRLSAAGVAALAGAPPLAALETLDLVATHLDDAAVAALAASPHLRGLRRLGLAENPGVTDAGLAALARSPVLASVRALAVHETAVTPAGIAAVRALHPQLDIANHVLTVWGG